MRENSTSQPKNPRLYIRFKIRMSKTTWGPMNIPHISRCKGDCLKSSLGCFHSTTLSPSKSNLSERQQTQASTLARREIPSPAVKLLNPPEGSGSNTVRHFLTSLPSRHSLFLFSLHNHSNQCILVLLIFPNF